MRRLCSQLLAQVQRTGFPTDDDWTRYCTKLVNHVHEADPDGERFRYPSSKDGAPLIFTRMFERWLAYAGLVEAPTPDQQEAIRQTIEDNAVSVSKRALAILRVMRMSAGRAARERSIAGGDQHQHH